MEDVGNKRPQDRWAKYLLVSYAIRRASYIIRALAGAYLVYLMYQLFSEAGKSQEELTVLMAAAGALMMAAGVYFVIGGAYGLLKGIYAENEPPAGSEMIEEAVDAQAASIKEDADAEDAQESPVGEETDR